MKRIMCLCLAITFLLSSLIVIIPAAAENAEGYITWNVNRGTWNISEDSAVCTGTADRQWIYSTQTVKADDNWSYSVDVDTAKSLLQFYFGSEKSNFGAQCNALYVHTFANGTFRVYYQRVNAVTGKAEAKQYGRTYSFPAGSNALKFNLNIVADNNNCRIYIDKVKVFEFDLSIADFDYKGGYFAIFQPNNNVTTYSNSKLTVYEKNQEKPEPPQEEPPKEDDDDTAGWETVKTAWNTVSGGWTEVDGVYSIVNYEKWNTAIFDKKLNNGDFVFETTVTDLSDSEVIHFLLGLSDNVKNTDDGYSVRLSLSEEATDKNAAVYYDKEKTRIVGWSSFPKSSDKKNFKIKIKRTSDVLKVFIDDNQVLTTEQMTEYGGGYIGFTTLQSKASFRDATISIKSEDNISPESDMPVTAPQYHTDDVSWNFITPDWKSCENGYITDGSDDSVKTAILKPRLDADEDFVLTADIENFTGEDKKFHILLGTTHSYIADGFSIRNEFKPDAVGKNTAFYQGKERKTGWMTWPAEVSSTDFKLRIEMKNKHLTVLADDHIVLWFNAAQYNGGYLGFLSSGISVKNVKLYTENRKNAIDIAPDSFKLNKITPAFKSLTYAAEKIKKGIYLGCLFKWNKAMSEQSIKGDYQFDADVRYVSGESKNYNFVFGCSDNEDTDSGYFLCVNHDNDTGKSTVQLRRSSGRVSGVFNVPDSVNIEDYHITVRFIEGVCAVYLDGIPTMLTRISESADGYFGLSTKFTSALFINMTVANRDMAPNQDTGNKAEALLPATGDSIGEIRLICIIAMISGSFCIYWLCAKKIKIKRGYLK